MVLHMRQELILTFFSLAASDDFADPWDQDIHRSHSLSIVVRPHVEGLDFLRIVEDGCGALKVLFS